jgi:hypothetical protein
LWLKKVDVVVTEHGPNDATLLTPPSAKLTLAVLSAPLPLEVIFASVAALLTVPRKFSSGFKNPALTPGAPLSAKGPYFVYATLCS